MTWQQVAIYLIMALPGIIAAIYGARNAAKLQVVRREMNGRVDQLITSSNAQARSEGNVEGLTKKGPDEDVLRVEQVLATFIEYSRQRNHEVLNNINSLQLRAEVVREEVKKELATRTSELDSKVEALSQAQAQVLAHLGVSAAGKGGV